MNRNKFSEESDTNSLKSSASDSFSLSYKPTWFLMRFLFLIIFYFSLSIGLTFYQRSLLQDLHFPLSIVVCHLFIKFVLASLSRSILEWYSGWPRLQTPWKKYVSRLAPIGISSGIEVGLSNWGLELITVSLYTMTKSTTVLFILMFSLIFNLEKKSWSLVLIVVLIASGLTMFTYKATEFSAIGFVLVLLASFLSGIRWTLAQVFMQHTESGHQNPLDVVYLVQPWMLLSVLPFAAFFEGSQVASSCLLLGSYDRHRIITTISKVVAGAILAFVMELSEYLVVVSTSSLTLSIAGVFKEVITLVLAVEWAGDQMSPVNVVGLVLCLGGICAHIAHKIRSSSKSSSPIRPSPVSNETGHSYEMRTPLLTDGNEITGALLVSCSEEDDSDENSDILYILNHRDRATHR
ncbi:Solute carrier family 35 member C2 [Frankliniella fusca]|uniref:Solute carrier family 35 member C2 n=1 Tax=Frankliniella fusca TaxID=407009 RepID=A0AAE1LVH2_9NEOP|nr:Solute carrier family 35 member C2 [Frankliniella fusca]